MDVASPVGRRQPHDVMSPGAAARIDEEAELGGWETSYGQPAQNPAPAYGSSNQQPQMSQQASNPYSNAAPQIQGGSSLPQQPGQAAQGQSLSGGAYNNFPTSNTGNYGAPSGQQGGVPPRKEMGGGGR